MRKHLRVLQLSAKGQQVLDECFRSAQRPTYQQIQARLKEATGEDISIQALSRGYHGYFRGYLQEQQQRAEERRTLVELLKTKFRLGDSVAEQIMTDFLNVGILANEKQLTEADPIGLLREQTRRMRVEVERDKVSVERDKVQLLKSKVESAAASVIKTAERAAGRSLTPAETKKIREDFYGLYDEEKK